MTQRTIEFRAWDGTKMYTHEELDKLDSDGIIHIMDIIKPNNPDKMIVTMWTGLHDRHGKKIFEGDVVKCLNGGLYKVWFGEQLYHSEEYGGKMGAIGFHIGEGSDAEPLGLAGLSATAASNPYEVVGNVFETPNLIA